MFLYFIISLLSIMQFSFSSYQLVLATTFVGTYILPINARVPLDKRAVSSFSTLHAPKSAGVQPSGSGGAFPTGTGTGAAVPTGGHFEAFVYDNTTKSNDTGRLVSVHVSKDSSAKADDPMESGTNSS